MNPIQDVIRSIADRFYRMEVNAAVKDLHLVVENVQDYVSQNVNRMTEESIGEMNQLLNLVVECIQNHDYILVADVLHHELLPRLQAE